MTIIWGNLRADQNEGGDCRILKVEILLSLTCYKVYKQQVETGND